jgi:hypothetical protein
MKIFFGVIAIYLGAVALAHAEGFPFVLRGETHLGEPCELTVENISFYDGWENTWTGIRLQLHTSLQAANSPSLEAHKSPTPAVLYGRSEATKEMISVHFARESLDPADIRYLIFQRPGNRGPIQTRCVFAR